MFQNLMKAMAIVAVMAVGSTAMAAGGGHRPNFTPREVSGVVNINTASAKELELLPGVGKHTAGLIVTYREKNQFKTTHDIVKVKGVGQGIYNKVKPYLTLAGPTTLAAVARSKPATPAAAKPEAHPASRAN
jgi:competence protein ComEA